MVKGLTWDPVGKYIASQADDRSLKVWRTLDWQLETSITKPFDEVRRHLREFGPAASLASMHRREAGWGPYIVIEPTKFSGVGTWPKESDDENLSLLRQYEMSNFEVRKS